MTSGHDGPVMTESDAGRPLPLRAHPRRGRRGRRLVVARPRGGVRRHRRGGRPGHAPARPQGKAAFAELRDSSGSVQLFARRDGDRALRRVRQAEPGRLGRGDRARWCGPERGELSVKVDEWELLAEARRNFGDKWRGVSDVETRYRQREVDLWANERSRQLLQLRSDVVRQHARAPVGPGLRRGRDAAAAPDRRRRHGAPVRHPPQHARHRPLPARRARALPQAPRRRRLRQGVRDRPHASATRASRRATTPSSRRSSSTRPTPTTPTPWSCSRSWWPGWPPTCSARRSSPTAGATST